VASRPLRWPSSLRSRLTLWYTALLGLPLVVFAIASYLVFARTLERRTDRFIGDALTAFARELTAERRTALSAVQAMQSTVEEVRFRDLQIAIADSTGRAVAMSAPPVRNSGDRDRFRVLTRRLAVGGQQFTLTGTYSLADIDEMLERIRGMFLIAIPLLVLAAAAGGYALARRSLAPVTAMGVRAAAISASNLDERLPVGGGDELMGLARVVNDLLDRLERSFAQQQRFVADASHELRTPTSILRTEAEVTLSRPHRAEEEYRASMAIVQDAARRLTRIVDDLFLLARADSGHLVARREPLYLEDLVHDAARAVRAVADRRGVKVELAALVEAPFQGDADLLGRLLLNLLDNAIKYSPEGGTVLVGMSRGDGGCEITVADEGAGIPPEAQERVFERFFRVDAARSRGDASVMSGAGLGLAIARRIAEMHGGRLELAGSRPGRTTFRLTLPVEGRPAELAAV
jgi:heavy metal sensor kinase